MEMKVNNENMQAFTLPGLVHLLKEPELGKNVSNRGPYMLVLAPTRELAIQIFEVAHKAATIVNLKAAVVYGGVHKNEQVEHLKKGVHLLVATPGRLLGLVEEGDLSLERVNLFVLDEADRMLDMGFIPDIRKVIGMICKKRQTVMFSATWPEEIQKLAKEFLTTPVRITIGSPDLAANVRISQTVEVTENHLKRNKLDELLKKFHKKGNKIIIFCLYKTV